MPKLGALHITIISVLLWLSGLASAASWQDSARVLVYTPDGVEAPAHAAAVSLGYDAELATSYSDFYRLFNDEGPWELIAVDYGQDYNYLPETIAELFERQALRGGAIISVYPYWEMSSLAYRQLSGIPDYHHLQVLSDEAIRGGAPLAPNEFVESLPWPPIRLGQDITVTQDADGESVFYAIDGYRVYGDEQRAPGGVSISALDGLAIHNLLRRESFTGGSDAELWEQVFRGQMRFLLADAYLLYGFDDIEDMSGVRLLGSAAHRLESLAEIGALGSLIPRSRGLVLDAAEGLTAAAMSAVEAVLDAGSPAVVYAPAADLEALASALELGALSATPAEFSWDLDSARTASSRRFQTEPHSLLGLSGPPVAGAFLDGPASEWEPLASVDGESVVLRSTKTSLVLVGAPLSSALPGAGVGLLENLLSNSGRPDHAVLILADPSADLGVLVDVIASRDLGAVLFDDPVDWLDAFLDGSDEWGLVVTDDEPILSALAASTSDFSELLASGRRLDIWSPRLDLLEPVTGLSAARRPAALIDAPAHLSSMWWSVLEGGATVPPLSPLGDDQVTTIPDYSGALPWLVFDNEEAAAISMHAGALNLVGWCPDLSEDAAARGWLNALLDLHDQPLRLNVLAAVADDWQAAEIAAGLAGLAPRRLTDPVHITASFFDETPLLFAIDPSSPPADVDWSAVINERVVRDLPTFLWLTDAADPAIGAELGLSMSSGELSLIAAPRVDTGTVFLGFVEPWPVGNPALIDNATANLVSVSQPLHSAGHDLGDAIGGIAHRGRLGFWGASAETTLEARPLRLLANLLVAAFRVPSAAIDAPLSSIEGVDLLIGLRDQYDAFGESLSFEWREGGGDLLAEAAEFVLEGASLDGPQDLELELTVKNESGLRRVYHYSVLIINADPVVELISPAEIDEGEPLEVVVLIDDVPADLDLMDVQVAFGDGVVVAANPTDEPGVWVASHLYSELGEWLVVATATDPDGGVGVDAVEVEVINVPPTLDVEPLSLAVEGTPQSYSAVATDPGEQPVSVRWTIGLDPPVTLDGSEVVFTYGRSGQFHLIVEATDSAGAVTSAEFFQVVENVPPTITSAPPLQVIEGQLYEYDLSFVDPGFENVHSLELLAGPDEMTLDHSGELRWRAEVLDYLPKYVALAVRDDGGGEDIQAFEVEVIAIDSSGGGAPDACKLRWELDPADPSDEDLDLTGDGLSVAEACYHGRSPTQFSGPRAPVPFNPIGGATWYKDELIFSWENAAPYHYGELTQPLVYDVELYGSATAESPLLSWEDIPEDSFISRLVLDEPPELGEDNVLWWRVRARDPIALGAWSARQAFLLNRNNRLPGRPEIVTPRRIALSNPPLISWKPALDDDGDRLSYELELGVRGELSGGDDQGPALELVVHVQDIESEPDAGLIEYELGVPLELGVEYFLRVRAWDHLHPGAYDLASFMVDLDNEAPPTPDILGPSDERPWLVAESITLAWSAVDDPDDDPVTYDLQLARSTSFDELLVTQTRLQVPEGGDGEWRVPEDFGLGEFFWRVRASDGLSESAWASARFRRVERNVPPSTPRPLRPAPGEVVDVGDVTFEFSNGFSASDSLMSYQLQVAYDEEFRRLAQSHTQIPQGSPHTSWVVRDLEPALYYWRVRAFDGLDQSSWSSVRRFSLGRDDPSEGTQEPDDTDETLSGGDEEAPSGGGGCAATQSRHSASGLILLLIVLICNRRRQGR